MRRLRVYLLLFGALLGVALVVPVALLIPSSQPVRRKLSPLNGCTRYFLIRVEWICGKNVVWVNPDGSTVGLGRSSQLSMPRARQTP